MLMPFFLGAPERQIYAAYHRPMMTPRSALLICPPLLQEYSRTYRALWALAEELADAGIAVLRFDYLGTGDSSGASDQLGIPNMLQDIRAALQRLVQESGIAQPRVLSFRSSTLPVLHAIAQSVTPVDVVLWDAQFEGASIVGSWRAQHVRQSTGARYRVQRADVMTDELLGLRLDKQFIHDFADLSTDNLQLPSGSRIDLVSWNEDNPIRVKVIKRWSEQRLHVSEFALPSADTPDWDSPKQFEIMVYPRRSVKLLAKRLIDGIVST